MDLMVTGRIRTALPALVEGLRRAQEKADPAVSKALLTRVQDAAPAPETMVRLASQGMAAAGSLRPPPPPATPTPQRVGPERLEAISSRARTLVSAVTDTGKHPSLDRLGRALDLLETSAREQRDLMQRGLGDLR